MEIPEEEHGTLLLIIICVLVLQVNGNAENFLEHAINTLNHISKDLSKNPSKEELKVAIRDCKNELKKDKYIKYVRKTRIKEN